MPSLPKNKGSEVGRGKFFVFEGGEGTGKSTQIKLLEQRLLDMGRSVVLSWEPGGTPVGERIRQILLDPGTGALDIRAEALLYAAARAEHVAKVLRPALERGCIVLCDRYWDASRAYQGIGRGLGIAVVDTINVWATEGLYPDKVFVFDFDAAKGLKRAEIRNKGQLDRVEQAGTSFHEKVRQGYLDIGHANPETHHIVDASQSVEDIALLLWKKIQESI